MSEAFLSAVPEFSGMFAAKSKALASPPPEAAPPAAAAPPPVAPTPAPATPAPAAASPATPDAETGGTSLLTRAPREDTARIAKKRLLGA